MVVYRQEEAHLLTSHLPTASKCLCLVLDRSRNLKDGHLRLHPQKSHPDYQDNQPESFRQFSLRVHISIKIHDKTTKLTACQNKRYMPSHLKFRIILFPCQWQVATNFSTYYLPLSKSLLLLLGEVQEETSAYSCTGNSLNHIFKV